MSITYLYKKENNLYFSTGVSIKYDLKLLVWA